MPRKRRPPTRADAIAYVHGRIGKLKGPRREIYEYLLDVLVFQEELHRASRRSETLCEECSERQGVGSGG